MNQRKYKDLKVNEILITDVDGLCKMLSMGKVTALKVAELAGARVHLPSSKTVRFSVKKIRDYIDRQTY